MGEAGEVEQQVIDKTKNTLGKIIKRPPLADKLLQKPPFKFLHDVITSVMRETGYAKGLYSDGELNSDSIKAKEQKMEFLQKTFDFLSFVLSKPIGASPGKVVSGKESTKTNEFLQDLAAGAAVNTADFVAKFLKGERYNPSAAKSKDRKDKEKKEKPKAPEPPPPAVEPEVQNGHAPDEPVESRPPARPTSAKGQRGRGKPAEPEDEEEEQAAPPQERARPQEAGRQRTAHPGQRPRSRRPNERTPAETATPPEPAAPPAAQPRAVRPPSARPPPPAADKEAAPVTRVNADVQKGKKATVIIQQNADSDDDDFVTQETVTTGVELPPQQTQQPEEEGESHGLLVDQLKSTKSKLEGGSLQQGGGKVQDVVVDSQTRKQRELVQKEMAKLCQEIQAMTRLATPLAKVMEYVQEDLDAMSHEISSWQTEYKQTLSLLKKEQSLTTSALEPLRQQLVEFESSITEQSERNAALKGNVARNQTRIDNMLATVSKI